MAAAVAVLLVPGEDDPATMMTRGEVVLDWTMPDGSLRKVRKFRQVKMPQLREDDLALPTLYLHTLDQRFRVKDGEYSSNMRSGNDNSELMLVLPEDLVSQPRAFEPELKTAFDGVVKFLRSQGEVMVSEVSSGGTLLNTKLLTKMDTHRLNFKLKTSRPKAGISLPKPQFGIPLEADIYLFVENHISVNFMTEKDREELEMCIAEFGNSDDKALQAFSVFLKVFYEGGFAYNKKKQVDGGYVPINLSITCLGVTPAFPDQLGISTGYPYQMKQAFLPFVDTVPVTIGAIAQMSDRHSRYGLCFTRAVHIWEPQGFEQMQDESDRVLEFASVCPHGGFYYVPSTLQKHAEIGGLTYAFGESKDAPTNEASHET